MEYKIDGFETPTATENNLNEVEERAILDLGQDVTIQRCVVERRGKSLNQELIDDVYFCPDDIDSYQELERRGLDRQIIRLRRVKTTIPTGTQGVETIFTTKMRVGENWGNWVEANYPREGDYSDIATKNLRERYRLKPFFTLSKTRTSWQLGDVTLLFDNIPGFGVVLEGEIHTSRDNVSTAERQLQQTFRVLGVRPNQKPETSVTNQLMRTRSFF